jgi:hypothetical protein
MRDKGDTILSIINATTRSNTRLTVKLAVCVIVGLLGVLYASGLRTFMS